MKATFDEYGRITIEPENGLEAYALKCWCNQNLYIHNGKTLADVSQLLVKSTIAEEARGYR